MMGHKRKRDQTTTDGDTAAPGSEAHDLAPPVLKKSKGQSRQEKSERRSKKKQQRKANGENHSKRKKDRVVLDVPELDAEDGSEDAPDDLAAGQGSEPLTTGPQVNPPVSQLPQKKKQNRKKRVDSDGQKKERSASRFVCFVGNLPYSATKEEVQAHFSKIQPSGVRMSTDKQTKQGKGFAFVEFDNYDKMKTCLKLYHHSIFDPGAKAEGREPGDLVEDHGTNTPKRRRINIELTAGGGGSKSQARKERIRLKNAKISQERERTRLKERAEQEQAAEEKRARPATGVNADKAEEDRGAIHPSRLSRVRH